MIEQNDGGIKKYLLRSINDTEKKIEDARLANDFWSAVSVADASGMIVVNEPWHIEKNLEKVIPVTKEIFNSTSNQLKNIAISGDNINSLSSAGRYAILLVAKDNKFNVLNNMFAVLPLPTENTDAAIFAAVMKWRQTVAFAQVNFHKQFLMNKELIALHGASANWLVAHHYFDAPFTSPGEIEFWQNAIKNHDIDRQARSLLLNNLADENFSVCRNVFLWALQDKQLVNSTIPIWIRHDEIALQKMMLDWLDNSEMREVALRNGTLLKLGDSFSEKVVSIYENISKANA